MTTKKRLGKTYKRMIISDLSIGDHFMNLSWKSAKLLSLDGKTCTISWTYGRDLSEGETFDGIWSNDTVWVEIK